MFALNFMTSSLYISSYDASRNCFKLAIV